MDDQTGVTTQRRTRAEIEQIVAEFAGSGLNRTEFCRRQHMSLGTLNRYLQRPAAGQDGDAHAGLVIQVRVSPLYLGWAFIKACGNKSLLKPFARKRDSSPRISCPGEVRSRLLCLYLSLPKKLAYLPRKEEQASPG
jgi:hypothetical protein